MTVTMCDSLPCCNKPWYPYPMRHPTIARPPHPDSPLAEPFTLGRDRFARISAVEGIALTDEMRAMLKDFDRDGLSAEERRRAILSRFAPRS